MSVPTETFVSQTEVVISPGRFGSSKVSVYFKNALGFISMTKGYYIFIAICVGFSLFTGGCSDNKSTEQTQQTSQSASPEVKISKWGPQGTTVGKGFSIQSNGNSAIWFEGKGIGRQLHNSMLNWYFEQTKTNVWLGN